MNTNATSAVIASGHGRSVLRFGRSAITAWLFVIFVVGAHLRLGVYSQDGALILPNAICVLMGLLLLSVHYRSFINSFLPGFLTLLGLLFTVGAITVLEGSSLRDIFRGTIQLASSIALLGLLIIAVQEFDRRRFRTIVFAIWLAFFVLAILEFVALRDFFSEITNSIYVASGRGVYDAVDRDVAIYGAARPRAFASEPSFLAFTLNSLAALHFLLHRQTYNQKAWLSFGGMIIAGYLISPSLTVIFFVLAATVWKFWPRSGSQVAFTLVAILLGLSGFLFLVSFTQAGLHALALVGGESVNSGSFYGRIVVGRHVAQEIILSQPLLGAGVGNEDAVAPIIERQWSLSGAFARFPWFYGLGPTDLQSNGFYWQWISLGFAGGVLFTLLVVRLIGALGVRHPFRSVVCAWLVWFSGSAFIDAISWYTLAIFCLGAIALRGEEGPTRVRQQARRVRSTVAARKR